MLQGNGVDLAGYCSRQVQQVSSPAQLQAVKLPRPVRSISGDYRRAPAADLHFSEAHQPEVR